MKPVNPFLIAGYNSPEYFCNRQLETTSAISSLKNNRNVTLISLRRMGNSALIKNIFSHLKSEKGEVALFYIDISLTENLVEFVQLLASTVLAKTDLVPQSRVKWVGNVIKSLHSNWVVDEFTGLQKVKTYIAPNQEESALKEILNYLQFSGKKCYIAIDEFHQVAEYPQKSVDTLLKSQIQILSNVHFIFSGSRREIMHELFLSPKRPFYQATQVISMEPIDKMEYYRFAAPFFEPNRTLHQDTFSYIYDEFNGHTWYMQAVLNKLYASDEERLDHDSVVRTITEIISEYTYTFDLLLKSLSPVAVKLIKAIAKERCVKEINSGNFIAQHGLKAASSVNTALKRLIHKEIIYKTAKGYSVHDHFMAIWLRQQIL